MNPMEKMAPPTTVLPAGDYNAWGQQTSYINPAYPSDMPPPAYTKQPHPVIHMGHVNTPFVTTHVVQQPIIMRQEQETSKARTLNFIGLSLAAVVLVMLVVGISTDNWAQTHKYNYGLWKLCLKEQQICFSAGDQSVLSVVIHVIRGFMFAAVILAAIAAFIHANMTFGRCQSKRNKAVTVTIQYSLATFCAMISIVLFGALTPSTIRLAWSFWLCTVSTIGCLALAIIVAITKNEYKATGAVIHHNPVSTTSANAGIA